MLTGLPRAIEWVTCAPTTFATRLAVFGGGSAMPEAVAETLHGKLAANVVVENRPGAGGSWR